MIMLQLDHILSMDFWWEGSENEFVADARNKEYEWISFFEDSSLFWGQIWWLAGNLSEKAQLQINITF